MQKSNNHIQAD